MDAITSKVYIILILIFVFMIIQLANARRRSSSKTQFPFMINAFKADHSALNPLQIAYTLKHMDMKFEIYPLLATEISEFLNEHDQKTKFNAKKSKSYYTLLKLQFEKGDIDKFTKEFSLKFDVVKVETKTNGSYELFIKEKFSHFNLSRMTLFTTDYLKRENPMEFKIESTLDSKQDFLQ